MSVTDYASAEAFLVNDHTKRPVPRKKIANHTYVERGGHITERGDQIREGEIGVVLHETAVVVYGERYIRLNSGGWLTMTTRERIERFTPRNVRLSSDRDARWIVLYHGTWDGPSVPFYDGIRLLRAGDEYLPSWEARKHDTSDEDAHNAMIRRLVKDYLAKYVKGELTATWTNCALCLWTDVPTMTGPYCTTAVIPSIGDRMDDQQHLIDHMLDGVMPEEMRRHACRETAGSLERMEIWLTVDRRSTESLRKFLLGRLLVGAVTHQHGRRPVVIPPPTIEDSERARLAALVTADPF